MSNGLWTAINLEGCVQRVSNPFEEQHEIDLFEIEKRVVFTLPFLPYTRLQT